MQDKRIGDLFRAIYPNSLLSMKAGTSATPIQVSAGEIWSTFGEYDRLTRLVLAAHRFRLGASISADAGFSVRLTPLGYHPDNPTEHHPGLGDLAASCYRMGGRKSDAELLGEARKIVESLLFAADGDAQQAALRFIEEVKSR